MYTNEMSSRDHSVPRGKGKSSPSEKSGLSISVDLRQQVTDLLLTHSRNAMMKGEPIQVFDSEGFERLGEQLHQLLVSQQVHSVTPIELSTLNAELAQARLQLNLFKSKAEKEAFAKKTSEEDVVRMRQQLDAEAKVRHLEVAKILEREEQLKVDLARLKNESGRLKQEIAKARTAKDQNKLDQVSAEKQKNGQEITRLNNLLQEANKTKADSKAALSKYQNQLLALTTELNFEKAKVNAGVEEKGTFSEMASRAGTATVDLFSSISKSLSGKSKEFVKKARLSDPADLKNKAHWINAALHSTKHAFLRPYEVLFEGIYEDIRVLDHHSRKQFGPLVDAMLDALSGKRNLSIEEIDKMLDKLDIDSMKMSHAFRTIGIETFRQYQDSGNDIRHLKVSDLDEGVMAEARQAFLKKEAARSGPSMSGALPAPKERSSPSGHTSVYTWVKRKVLWGLEKLQSTAASRPKARPSVKATSWLKQKLGFVGALMSLPVAFFSFITGAIW